MIRFDVKNAVFKHPPSFLTEVKDQYGTFKETEDFIYNLPEIDDDQGPENVDVEISNLEEDEGTYNRELNQITLFNRQESVNRIVKIVLKDQDLASASYEVLFDIKSNFLQESSF